MQRHALRAAGIILWLGACGGDSTGPSPVQFVVRPEWLTPDVQPFLDADGQFAFPDDWQTREGDMPPAQAAAVTVAWARIRSFPELFSCSTPRILRTPLGRVADDTQLWARHALGSQWLVMLCRPPKVPVAFNFVAAQSAITTSADGKVVFPPFVPGVTGGSDMTGFLNISTTEPNRLGPDVGSRSTWFSAEEAVARTVEATGRRIAALPRAIGSIFITNPQGCGRWEMVLESPITVQRDGAPVATDTLYVPAIHCFEEFGFSVASPERIGEDLIQATLVRDSLGTIVGTRELRIPIELPIVFHPVTIPPA